MRVGSVELAEATRAWIATHGRPDVVVGTNMLDLASYLGFLRHDLGSAPTAQFLHENQLSYPRRPDEPLDRGLAWMQWRGLVAADAVWCNSAHHRDALVEGLANLESGRETDSPVDPSAIEARLEVIHLGIEFDELAGPPKTARPRRPLVVLNHRWHHDKDLGSVLRALRVALERGPAFDIALLGDPNNGEAQMLEPMIDVLGSAVKMRGFLPRAEYVEVLRRADVVVSAARNENFGLSVVEAVAAGAWPVAPDALAYPEVIPSRFHPECLYGPGGLGARLRDVLARVAEGETAPDGLATAMARFAWPTVADRLDTSVEQLLDGSSTV